MKEEGPRLGYQKYADAITKGPDGNYEVKNKALRTEILKLREDPQVAADMAAAFTESNGRSALEIKFGRMPSPGELYIAHFLGPQGAEKMFDAGLKNPDQVAATLFPSAAKANPQIFYDGKHARTIREVYKALVATHNAIEGAPLPAVDPAFATQQLAGTGATPGGPTDATNPATGLPTITPKDMSFTALFANGQMPPPGTPLVGAEAAAPIAAAQPVVASAAPATEPLAAIDAATAAPAPTVGDPLPAPAPLVAPLALAEAPNAADPSTAPAPAAAAVQAAAPPTVLVATAPDAVASLRQHPGHAVELSPGVMPNPAFFTQLLWQDGDGPLTRP